MQTEDFRSVLREIYSDRGFQPRVWKDASDAAYPGIINIERAVARLAPDLRGEVLDIGCGTRPYADYFRHVDRMRGCDLSARRGPVDFECPAHAVPLPAASLDGIFCTEVLEHVPNPQAVWQEFARLLKPGGKVLLATPMSWPAHEEPNDFFRYTAQGLQRLAADAGFNVLKMYPRGGVWAFFAQAIQHSIPQYLRWRWQRRWLNEVFLTVDRWRCNPRATIGWTILAERR